MYLSYKHREGWDSGSHTGMGPNHWGAVGVKIAVTSPVHMSLLCDLMEQLHASIGPETAVPHRSAC